MSLERWQQVTSIVSLAMDTPRPERKKVVHTACGNDPALRLQVESLLAAADAADRVPEARAAIAPATGAMVAEQDAALRSVLESALGHQYDIIRLLGRGGMGCVYLARERALERFVAIKVLLPDLADAAGHRERFRREARIAARLAHPSILALHSFGEIDSLWYFVMTYVRGETLAARLAREGHLAWVEAHRILSEMADALDCAHRNGVVHRDIKPANILLDSETGRAVLADFGISRMQGSTESLTATGALLGTPDFMSPEQLTGASDIDQRSDIYSLGAVAYVMMTGREPFGSSTAGATIYRRLIEDPTPPNAIVPSIPADLSAIVQKCMARDREQRWPDARSLRQALDNIVAAGQLPDTARDLPSFGPYAVLWAASWAGFALLTDRSITERALLIFVALIVPIGLMLQLWTGAGRGMRFVDLVRIALWPPEWWGMWWPRALRRPTDVWDRLPWIARAVRILLIAFCPVLLLVILLRSEVAGSAKEFYESWVAVAEWAIVITGLLAVAAGVLWGRRRGLALDQSLRLLVGPTLASSGWTDPGLTRLLAPASGKVRAPDRDVPSDYLRAIRELVPLLPITQSDAGLRTIAAAECVLTAIGQSDRELASLSRDASRGEADRLAAQLDALDSASSGHTGERAELRGLVQHQLDIVRRMQSRREVVLGERAHLVDMLRALWALAQTAGDGRSPEAGVVERLEALCVEIRRELGPLAVA